MGRGRSHPSRDTMPDTSHGNKSRDEGYETVPVFRNRAVPSNRFVTTDGIGKIDLTPIIWQWGLDSNGVEMTRSFFVGSTAASVLQTQALEGVDLMRRLPVRPIFSTRPSSEKESLLKAAFKELITVFETRMYSGRNLCKRLAHRPYRTYLPEG
jgi:hypothetical protein